MPEQSPRTPGEGRPSLFSAAIEAMRRGDRDWLLVNGWMKEVNGVRTYTQRFCDEANAITNSANAWVVVVSALAREIETE